MANKLVSLRLVRFTYSGESIGNDITIEVEAADRRLSVQKDVSVGQSIALKEFVGSFVTAQRSFSLPITLRVIERDRVFNDVGSTTAVLRVDLADSAPQRFQYAIEVEESGAILSNNVALFEVELEAKVMPATRYVAETGDGWLQVELASGKRESLSATIKVEVYAVDAAHEYFAIMEGHYRDQRASVKLQKDGTSYLGVDDLRRGPARLTYHISTRMLEFQGRTYQTKTQRDRWDGLYAALVRSRKGDGISVGTVEVID